MNFKKIKSLITAAIISVTAFGNLITSDFIKKDAAAATFSYPVQEFRMGIGDTNRNINISGTSAGSSLNSWVTNGGRNEKWYLNYVSSGVYEIVNSATDLIVTNENSTCVLRADTNAANQRFKIVGVDKDFEGYYLYYKIVSNENNNLAVTFNPTNNSVKMTTYSGDIYQKFKLNLDGLEGFAANCKVSGKEKAGTIGGLLGETVFVSTVSELITALDSTDPKTVVVTANIDLVNQSKEKQRIRDNKTLIGSYSNHTIYDSQLRNDDFWGKDASPSNNIVIRNMEFVARTLNSTNSGVILLQFYGVRNLWIDHCNFSATFGQNKDQEVGKFIWINTPATNWSDAVYNKINPDYITISYNYLKNRYWTVAYGSQNTDTSRIRTTLMYNKWEQCSRRCPQIGNGTGHLYSSFHTVTGSSNSNASSQIIAGEGSNMLSENMRFEAYSGKEIDIDKNTNLAYKDSGSYTASSTSATPTKLSVTARSTAISAKDCYGYSLVAAYNTNNTDVKAFCNAYSGCFKSYDKIKYITDSDMEKYISYKYANPFLKNIEVGNGTIKNGAVMDTNNKYMFKNVNSGLYLEVADGVGANGTNVQQGAAGETLANTWKLVDGGDGYYYVRSCTGDGKTYYLDLDYGKADNGTNIGIWVDTKSDAQLFKFVDNGDGTYTITTKVTEDKSCVEVSNASTASGANIQQYEINDNNCQKWIAEKITIKDGATLDESKCYMFKNVGSDKYLEVDGGLKENGANVQQWGASGPASHNVWHVKYVDWGYYYVYSALGDGQTFLLNVNGNGADGVNIDINENNTYSSQYFKFVDNEDGTFTIVTRASKDLSCVAIGADSTDSGANVLQWTMNYKNSQKWVIEEVDYTLPVITTTTTSTTTTTTSTTTIATTTMATTTAVNTTETTTNTTETTTEIAAKLGDANGDGEVDMGDAIAILKYCADPVGCALSEQAKDNADVCFRGDGIDASDALSIQKLRAKQIDSLPESYYKQ